MSTKILITGGAGLIGGNFIRYILNKYDDYCIVNFDRRLFPACGFALKDIERDHRYKFIKGNICKRSFVNEVFKKEKFDFIVNFAAVSHVGYSILDPENSLKTNILGTQVLLEASKINNVTKFLQISTDEVYGSSKERQFKETDILLPNNPYSSSKAGAELLARAYHKTFGLPILITRSSNNFGPYQFPEKLISFFITNLLDNKKVPLHGNGLNIRDWIYVLDNCAGINTVLHHGKIGEIYNIGGGNEKTNIEITKIILRELGKDKSFIEYVEDRPGNDLRYSLDSTKIKELGWEPKHNFEDAILETIEWYKKNRWWWEKIKY